MIDEPLCQYLEWDSNFFGQRIGRFLPDRLSPGTLQVALAWCETNAIDCLYFLADAGDARTVQLAEKDDFNLVDVRVTLQLQLKNLPAHRVNPTLEIRPAHPSDLTALSAIARVSHRDTRFYFDHHFAIERCDDLYATWIERSCDGYADVVLVADQGGQVVGYVSDHLHDQGMGQIGLFAVSAENRGKGWGRALIEESLLWFRAAGVQTVSVVTQGRNIVAQRLYQEGGFRIQGLQLWYHHWHKLRKLPKND